MALLLRECKIVVVWHEHERELMSSCVAIGAGRDTLRGLAVENLPPEKWGLVQGLPGVSPRFSATGVSIPAGRLIPGDSEDAGGELRCFIETV